MTINEGQRRLLDDCFLHDKDRLRHDDALDLLRQRISPIAEHEKIDLTDAHGHILAIDVVAPRNIPGFDNAAVDGYALTFADIDTTREMRMPVSMRIPAGAAPDVPLKSGTVARIFTGAQVPERADTIIMQEDVVVEDDGDVTFPAGIKPGINLRKAGEDLAAGSVVVASGERIRAPELTAIASCGCNELTCFKPLSVGLLSTGDEIIRPGTPYAPGNVYDANYYLMKSMISSTGARVSDLGIASDKADDVERLLLEAAQKYDVIITSGGKVLRCPPQPFGAARRGQTAFPPEPPACLHETTPACRYRQSCRRDSPPSRGNSRAREPGPTSPTHNKRQDNRCCWGGARQPDHQTPGLCREARCPHDRSPHRTRGSSSRDRPRPRRAHRRTQPPHGVRFHRFACVAFLCAADLGAAARASINRRVFRYRLYAAQHPCQQACAMSPDPRGTSRPPAVHRSDV